MLVLLRQLHLQARDFLSHLGHFIDELVMPTAPVPEGTYIPPFVRLATQARHHLVQELAVLV